MRPELYLDKALAVRDDTTALAESSRLMLSYSREMIEATHSLVARTSLSCDQALSAIAR